MLTTMTLCKNVNIIFLVSPSSKNDFEAKNGISKLDHLPNVSPLLETNQTRTTIKL